MLLKHTIQIWNLYSNMNPLLQLCKRFQSGIMRIAVNRKTINLFFGQKKKTFFNIFSGLEWLNSTFSFIWSLIEMNGWKLREFHQRFLTISLFHQRFPFLTISLLRSMFRRTSGRMFPRSKSEHETRFQFPKLSLNWSRF